MAATVDQETHDEHRLPWLESVDDDYDEGGSVMRTALFALIGLVAICAAVALLFWLNRDAVPDAGIGTGALIAAPEGDYKVKPDTPGGMKVEGEGDTSFATSEGKNSGNASIDLKATPEMPIGFVPTGRGKAVAMPQPAPAAAPPPPAAPVAVAGAVPASGGRLTAPTPVQMPPIARPVAGSAGGALVQLGSFPNEAAANAAWARSAKRFAYLAPLGKSVQVASVNGATVYRLRVNAGSAGQATELCGKLKIAGEACFVPRN